MKDPAKTISLDEAQARVETKTAPRVTKEAIEAKIYTVRYYHDDTMTFCIIEMRNGFKAIGKSAPADPNNFDPSIGKRYAYEDAFRSLWPLEGYLLCEQLHAHNGAVNLMAALDAAAEDATIGPDAETIELAARTAHEVNRAYCQSIGDFSQPSWDDAPQWQKDSAIAGVWFLFDHPDATPADSHQSWLDTKYADGWVWGETKNPEFKTHPAMLPYDKLPDATKAKDALFGAAVRAVLGIN